MKQHSKCDEKCDVSRRFGLEQRACADGYCTLQELIDELFKPHPILDLLKKAKP